MQQGPFAPWELPHFFATPSLTATVSQSADFPVSPVLRPNLAYAKLNIDKKDVEGAWHCLNAARRMAVFGLARDEIAMRARVLREESQKVFSWRPKAMQTLLTVEDSELTAERLVEAIALRDEYSGNQYYKVSLVADQLGMLLLLSVAALLPHNGLQLRDSGNPKRV